MFDPNLKWLSEEWESMNDLRLHIAAQKQTGIPDREALAIVLAEEQKYIITKI